MKVVKIYDEGIRTTVERLERFALTCLPLFEIAFINFR